MESLIIFSNFSFSSLAPVKSGFVFPFPLSFIRVYDLDRRHSPWIVQFETTRTSNGLECWIKCPILETLSYNFHNFGYFRRFQEAMIDQIEEMKKKISTKIIFNYKCTIFMTYFGFQIGVSDWPCVPSNQNLKTILMSIQAWAI